MLAAAPTIAPVSPLSYVLGILAAVALVAVVAYAGPRLLLLARRALTFHRAGMARLQAADTADRLARPARTIPGQPAGPVRTRHTTRAR